MQVKKHLNLLGKRVEDRVSGVTGVVASVSFDLYGCIQVLITPKAKEDGERVDSRWYDIIRIKVLEHAPVMEPPDFDFGDAAEGRKGPAEKATFRG